MSNSAVITFLPSDYTGGEYRSYQFQFNNPNNYFNDLLVGIRLVHPNAQISGICWFAPPTNKPHFIVDERSLQEALRVNNPLSLFVYPRSRGPQMAPMPDFVFPTLTMPDFSPRIPTAVSPSPLPADRGPIWIPPLDPRSLFEQIPQQMSKQQPYRVFDEAPLSGVFGDHVPLGMPPAASQSDMRMPAKPDVFVEHVPLGKPPATSQAEMRRSVHSPPPISPTHNFEQTNRNWNSSSLSPAGAHGELHCGVKCDGCQGAIYGVRYKCEECQDYDLCEQCKQAGQHRHHRMEKIVLRGNSPRPPEEPARKFPGPVHRQIRSDGSEGTVTARHSKHGLQDDDPGWTTPAPISEAQRRGGWSALNKANK